MLKQNFITGLALLVTVVFIGLSVVGPPSEAGSRLVWVSQERATYMQVQDFLNSIGPERAAEAKVTYGNPQQPLKLGTGYRIFYRVEKTEKAEDKP